VGRSALIIALVAMLTLGNALPAAAVIGNPADQTTSSGVTSIPATQGKARGSGLWGFAGDVKTRNNDTMFN